MEPNNTLALAITKAIGYTENGGKPELSHLEAGKSGEMKSIFQFEPSTWKLYSKQVAGKDLPLNPDNETKVVAEKVNKWLQEGKTPEQIFSMWNAGESQSDAYTGKFSDGQSSIGVNKEGVKYNVPAYVKNGMSYLQQFEPQIASEIQGQSSLAQAGTPLVQGGQSSQPAQASKLEPILTKIQSMVSPQSTPMAVKKPVPPIVQGGQPGLIAGMLPQYGQKL